MRPTGGRWASLMGTLKDFLGRARDKTQADKNRELFRLQMEHMSQSASFTTDVYLKMLQDMRKASGLTGTLKEQLPWVQNNPFLKDSKRQEELILALTPEQRVQLQRAQPKELDALAATTGKDIQALTSVWGRLQRLTTLHRWLRRRVARGYALPRDETQLELFYMNPHSGRRLPPLLPPHLRKRATR
ncbi:hypothetical protein CDCA_CDCA03G0842 [Cyanidium caldarium]|uniref:Uncharacterized protein n=1 Tax=Cyanidium caldarium TaxID=2771 RepID=A0AAV9IRE7_CYACA|nr:hypothetical protein CDCA_CDCA03G0842 [Cyanidium caldarium]